MRVIDIVKKYMRDYDYSQLKSKKKGCSCYIDATGGGLFHCRTIIGNCFFYSGKILPDYLFPANKGEVSIKKLVQTFMKINGLTVLTESACDPDCGCSMEASGNSEVRLFECGYEEFAEERYCRITK